MVCISLEEKHKAETLGTPVSDLALVLSNGDERLNIREKEFKFHKTFSPS